MNTNKVSEGYFSADYSTAQTRFREAARGAGGSLHSLELAAKGPDGESLSIDIAWLGGEKPRRGHACPSEQAAPEKNVLSRGSGLARGGAGSRPRIVAASRRVVALRDNQ